MGCTTVTRSAKQTKTSSIQSKLEQLERNKAAVLNPVAHLQQVAPLVHLLDVFVGEDAAGSLQLALSLSRPSGDDGLVQTAHRQGAGRPRSDKLLITENHKDAWEKKNTLLGNNVN